MSVTKIVVTPLDPSGQPSIHQCSPGARYGP